MAHEIIDDNAVDEQEDFPTREFFFDLACQTAALCELQRIVEENEGMFGIAQFLADIDQIVGIEASEEADSAQALLLCQRAERGNGMFVV